SGGSCSQSILLTPSTAVPPTPTCSLQAVHATGNDFSLTWMTTGATTVSMAGGAFTSNQPSGTQTVTGSVSTPFTLTATSAGGSCTKALNLTPALPAAPTCALSSAPASGSGFNLTWATTNATSAHLSDGTTTLSTALSGTQRVTPSVTTTYTLN